MKRILSLVLVLVLVLGSVPVAFADDMTAGEMLKDAGFVAGDQNGNLMEDQKLTREQMMVLIAEMNGVKEEAATFSIPADFTDVNENDWFAPYVWYAFYQGWTAGMGDGSFGAGLPVDSKMAATFMLKALDYDVADYNMSVEQAKDLGIEIADSAQLTRGEGFKAMWATVNLPKQGSEVALGVELGRLEATEQPGGELTAAKLDTVEAISANRVYVEFDAAVDAAAAADEANYVIVQKGDAAKTLEVIDAQVDTDTIVVLTTEGMKDGQAYTLTVDESSVNYTGISKESDAPELSSVKAVDGDQLEVKFDMKVTKETAEDVANYSIDKEGTVVKAELDKEDRDLVTLTVEGFTTTASKKLTVENVVSVDDIKMAKETRQFSPKFDTKSPKIDEVEASPYNNVEVIVDFDDDHGVDKATAEDISNYAIDGLEIYSAKAVDVDEEGKASDDDDYYNRVILSTSEQSKSKNYTLKVLNMVDGSTAKNATTKTLEEKFRGGSDDDDKPSLASSFAKFVNLEEVHVTFTEKNALDPATALDLANYSFEDNELDITDIYFDDEDDNGNAYDSTDAINNSMDSDEIVVVLKVSGVEEGEKYKLIVDDIADNFGNTMDEKKDSIEVKEEVQGFAPIIDVKVTSLEKVEVYFDAELGDKAYGDLDEDTAEDPTNYSIEGLGSAKSATLKKDSDQSDAKVKVVLEIPEMTVGKTYEIKVNNVKNLWGYAAEDVTKKFIANPEELEDEKPEISDVDYNNKGELVVTFDQAMRVDSLSTRQITVVKEGTTTPVVATLNAVAARDGDTVLVFDAQASNKTGATEPLKLDTEYAINTFVNVESAAGLKVEHELADGQTFTTDSDEYEAKDDGIEVDNIYQENGDTIFVYFEEDIKLASTVTSGTILSSTGTAYNFTMDTDSDEPARLELTKTSGVFPKDEKTLKFNFASTVTDVLGRPVYMGDAGYVEVDVEYDDEDAPEVDSVTVLDNVTIDIQFDEKLGYKGSWTLKDEDGDKYGTVSADLKSSDTKVRLTVSKAMEVGKYYTVSMSTAPRDLANNSYDDKDETWDVLGVDNAPEADFVGLQILNATTAKITGDNIDEDLATSKVVLKANGTAVTTAAYTVAAYDEDADSMIITIDTDANYFKQGVNYTVQIDGNETSAKVNGILKEDTLVNAVTSSSTVAKVTFADYSMNDDATTFSAKLYNATTDAELVDITTKAKFVDSDITIDYATGFDAATTYYIVVREDGVVMSVSKDFKFTDFNN